MLDGIVAFIERYVKVPLWLFLVVASKFGYDIVAMFGLLGAA
ncbi:hypothetical protein Pori2_00016 [Pseudomonas phage vB_PpuP-Pori-2]